jgi:hypothetical protein
VPNTTVKIAFFQCRCTLQLQQPGATEAGATEAPSADTRADGRVLGSCGVDQGTYKHQHAALPRILVLQGCQKDCVQRLPITFCCQVAGPVGAIALCCCP